MRAAVPVALLILAGLFYRGRGDVVRVTPPRGKSRLGAVAERRPENPMVKDEIRSEALPGPEAPRSEEKEVPPAPGTAAPEPASLTPPLLARLEHELRLDSSQISYLVRILQERPEFPFDPRSFSGQVIGHQFPHVLFIIK